MGNARGVILIMSFLVMIALSAIVTTYLFVTSVVTKSAGYGVNDDQSS